MRRSPARCRWAVARAVTVAPFAQTRLKRPAGADADVRAAREAELVAWFEGGGE